MEEFSVRCPGCKTLLPVKGCIALADHNTAISSRDERIKVLEAEKAAMEYIDEKLLALLKEKGADVTAINLGIEALAMERESLRARVSELEARLEEVKRANWSATQHLAQERRDNSGG